MKFFTEKRTIHKIIIAVVFVILFNFVSPNISFASEAVGTVGGILFEPIKDLLLVIADGIMQVLQGILFGMDTSFVNIQWQDETIIEGFTGNLASMVGTTIGVLVAFAGVGLAPFTGGVSLTAVAAGVKIAAIGLGTGIIAGKAVTYLTSKALPEKMRLPMFVISPEEIFQNKIALLDVNFFNPNSYDDIQTQEGETVEQQSSALTLRTNHFSMVLRYTKLCYSCITFYLSICGN